MVARLVHVQGDVRIRRAGGGPWSAADEGAELHAEDTIQAMAHGSAELAIVASGATARVDPSTTIQLPRPADGALEVTGHLVVRVATTRDPAEVKLRLPPGTLLLRAEVGSQPVVEAEVDVGAVVSSIEMREGAGTVALTTGKSLSIARDHWVRMHADGGVEQGGKLGPAPVLTSPPAGARVRTTGAVELRWEAVPDAESYVVTITAAGVEHHVETALPIARPRFISGAYAWSVQARAAGELWSPSERRPLDVEVDTVAPPLVVTEPADQARLIGPLVRFSGTSEPAATIEIGSTRGKADAHGAFSLEVPIAHGLSNLVVRARDELGNERRTARSVLWE